MNDREPLVRVDREGSVGIVTLARPGANNAIDLAMSRDLLKAAIACDQDERMRAVLLRAEGKAFCVGGDIRSFGAAQGDASALLSQETAYLHAAVSRLLRMDKPLVTSCHGVAAGAGVSLALLGDIALAGESAQFTLAYTGIGLTPDGGASWLLPRLIGLRQAQRLFLTNAVIGSAEAKALGLVTELASDATLSATAMEWAKRLAAGPVSAHGHVRALLLSAYGTTLESHLEIEARGISAAAGGAEGQEGFNAFLGKRAPVFLSANDMVGT